MSSFVVDASVALTWCFPDENSPTAQRILTSLRTPGNRAVAPAFFHQEVLNALLMGERRGRITPSAVGQFLGDVLSLPILAVPADAAQLHATEILSRIHRLTA